MADEKKPGFFKRLFGFGKPEEIAVEKTPGDQTPIGQTPAVTPEITSETPPLIEDSAARIAAEIAEAKRLASETEDAAQRKAQASAEAQQRAIEKAATLKAQKDKQRAEAKAQADKTLASQILADKAIANKAAAQKLAQEQFQAAKIEAEERARARQAEAIRLAQEQAKDEAAKLQAARLEAEAAKAAIPAPVVVIAPAPIMPASVPSPVASADTPAPKTNWWQKLKSGLSRTASSVSDGITGIFTKRKLDAATLEDLEDILIQADLGIDVAARISAAVGKGRYDKEIDPEEVKAILAEEVAKVLMPVAQPLVINVSHKPFVLLMIGVNGSGKTTTIGKLASKFRAEGRSVMLAAGDTFRAAAIEQLKIWGTRTGASVVAREQGGDAAGLAFDALKTAKEQNIDILLIDTAGRLQNRTELMAELEKVIRVIRKMDETAPHAVLLVLDATVGQNALSQVEIFGKVAGVTGLVMTKLDGTARGGILVAIAEKFKLPVHFIGVGEGVDDLEPFEAQDFARAIAGLDQLGR
jgi:fused signal recognition particle receptor